MSLMKSAAADRVAWICTQLTLLKETEEEAAEAFETDYIRGRVNWEDITFAMDNGKLVIVGFCPLCGMEAYSRPVKRLADIADIHENFRPIKHNCAEV